MSARSLFLSYNRQDKASVGAIAERLREQEIQLWRDFDNLPPGSNWIPEIQSAIATCSAAAVFYGPSGAGKWQSQEEQMALRRSVDSPNEFHVIPVLLPGGEIPKESILGNFTWVEFPDLQDRGSLSRLIWGIDGIVPPPPAPADTECPYRGLSVFEVEHARFFFGRDQEKEQLLARVRDMISAPDRVRFAGLLGGSGSGKSSLMRAGLLYQLKNGMAPGSAEWDIYDFLPGAEPLKMLALQVMKWEGGEPTGARLTKHIDDLQRDPKMLDRDVAAALLQRPDRRVVLLVDQLEEVFTSPEAERKALFDCLLYAATKPGGQTIVLFTLRVDFYNNCTEHPQLAQLLPANHLLVGPIGPDQLRKAIEAPARAVGCEVEPALTEVLLDECGNEPGNLPLLQFVLLKLWTLHKGQILTLATYEKLGRLHGALDQHAEGIYQTLTPDQQKICKTLFLQLAQPWRDDRFTRRRVTFAELFARRKDAAFTQSLNDVLKILSGKDARLLTIQTPDHGHNQIEIDIAHEALLTSWDRLSSWLKEARDFLDWRQALELSIKDWIRHARDPECLLTGSRLDEAKAKQAQHPDELTSEETDFIRRSIAYRRSERTKRAVLIAGEAAFSLALIAAVVLWFRSRMNLLDQTRAAIANHSPCAVVYALHADQLQGKSITGIAGFGSAETRELLEEAVQGSSSPLIDLGDDSIDIADIQFSPDGKYLATAAYDKTATLWNLNGASVFSIPMAGIVRALAFNRTGSFAAADQTGMVKLWQAPFTVPQQPAAVTALAFGPAKNSLLMGTVKGDVQLWSAETQSAVPFPSAHTDEVTSIALSPDKTEFVTASKDGTAKLWSFQTKTSRPLPGNAATMDIIGFAGNNILAGSLNGRLHAWDRSANSTSAPLLTNLNGMAISADGNAIATSEPKRTGTGNTIRIWRSSTLNKPSLSIELPDQNVRKLALNLDGSRLAVALKGKVRVYELADAAIQQAAQQKIAQSKEFEKQHPGSLNDCRP